jgi:hypothetical protein
MKMVLEQTLASNILPELRQMRMEMSLCVTRKTIAFVKSHSLLPSLALFLFVTLLGITLH